MYKDRQDFGNLLHDDLDTIWNNEHYLRSRALFGKNPAERAGTICDGCFLFKRPLGVAAVQAHQNGTSTSTSMPISLISEDSIATMPGAARQRGAE